MDKKQNTPSNERHKLKVYHILFLLLLIGGTIYVACENNKKVTDIKKCKGSIFGTIYNITYHSDCDLHEEIKEVLQKVDNSLSPFNKNSNITAINNNKTDILDKDLLKVFSLAKDISKKTYGAFDITVAPLVNLWGFGFENYHNVDSTRIDSLKNFVGFEKIRLENGKLLKSDPRIQLDCSAIAKGYGVDAIGMFLESKGVKDYMVEIGGEIRTRGSNPNGAPWRIGITNPQDDISGKETEIKQVLELTDVSLATSGNYRNYYIKEDKKYAHTIDPRTGYPVQHNILSSTVIAKDCATADAYATSFMVLGLDSAILVLEKNPDINAYFIYSIDSINTGIWYSPNISKMIKNL
jgi:thiamine biosynthesis lipoprotein